MAKQLTRILIPELFRDWYVSSFHKCKKCGFKINAKKGFWKWDNIPPQIGGYYHTECGTIGHEDFTENFIKKIK